MAGLMKPECKAALALCSEDEVSLGVAIAACLLRPGLPVISRANSEAIAASTAALGVYRVISPFREFAERVALAMRAPNTYRLLGRVDRRARLRSAAERAAAYPSAAGALDCLRFRPLRPRGRGRGAARRVRTRHDRPRGAQKPGMRTSRASAPARRNWSKSASRAPAVCSPAPTTTPPISPSPSPRGGSTPSSSSSCGRTCWPARRCSPASAPT